MSEYRDDTGSSLRDEDAVFFDETDFKEPDKAPAYRGRNLSVISFVIAASAAFLALIGLPWAAFVLCAAAMVTGITAIALRHGETGFAIGSIAIAALTVLICIWVYLWWGALWGNSYEENSESSVPSYDESSAEEGIQGLVYTSSGGDGYVRKTKE